jgi:hypothetical protein
MKKIVLAVSLVVAFAAPAAAQNFDNPYVACDSCRQTTVVAADHPKLPALRAPLLTRVGARNFFATIHA